MKTILVTLCIAALPWTAARAQEVDIGSKAKAAASEEDARDLGSTPPPGVPPEQRRDSTYVDLNPFMHLQFGEDTAAFAQLELFGSAGDTVIQNESDRPVASQNFAALRELWLEYGGITSYPGEVLRLGLQRVRDPDGLWWDRDIESVRWIFDTTLVQSQIGVAEQLGTYRTDDVKLTPSQRHRAYAFAELGSQWQPGYYSGVRIAYAQDHENLPDVGTTEDADTKTRERKYLWVALHTHNGFFDPRAAPPVQYWLEAVGLAGNRESAQTNPLDPNNPNQVVGIQSDRVTALAGDAGLRIRFPLIFPFELGAIASYAQGDPGDSSTSHVFESTGLESNRSRFTGSRTLINRFNEALQANWSNIRAAGGLMSMPWEMGDVSLVYQRFFRDDGTTDFSADGITAKPVNDSRDIGRGFDVVLTKFFQGAGTQVKTADDEDKSANVRLRASRFDPGEAYGAGVNREYRVTLETTWWF